MTALKLKNRFVSSEGMTRHWSERLRWHDAWIGKCSFSSFLVSNESLLKSWWRIEDTTHAASFILLRTAGTHQQEWWSCRLTSTLFHPIMWQWKFALLQWQMKSSPCVRNVTWRLQPLCWELWEEACKRAKWWCYLEEHSSKNNHALSCNAVVDHKEVPKNPLHPCLLCPKLKLAPVLMLFGQCTMWRQLLHTLLQKETREDTNCRS